jgi:hypothetical protein
MAAKNRRGLDLRDYWPWYERSWHVKGGHAEPPPFELDDIRGEEPPPPGWAVRALQVLIIGAAAVLVVGVLWAIFQ